MSKKLEHDQLDSVNEVLSRSEQFIEQKRKPILIGIIILIVVVAAIMAIRQFYMLPREAKAQSEMFKGTYYFEKDSFQLAVKGNGGDFAGFESIADEYSSTDAGNLAKAYTGISYMRMGQYDNAIKYLKDFDADDILISPAIVGAIGDCYVEMDKTKEGVSYFEKAAEKADNNLISPIYLKKAGIAYESLGENDKAVKAYQTIKDKYATSVEAADIDKYIEKASVKK